MTLLHMHKGFSHYRKKQTSLDIIRWCHCDFAYINGGGYVRKCAQALGLLSGLLLKVHLVPSCFGSHIPSVSATSVPLEEWDYNHTGKCSLFV